MLKYAFTRVGHFFLAAVGLALLSFRKHKFIAAVLGMLLTGAPMLWFVSWLQSQGDADTSLAANWAVGNVELNLDRAVATLNELAGRGVDSCRPVHVDMMRRAVFGPAAVKELSVIGANGQTLCTDDGPVFPRRTLLASTATGDPDITLELVGVNGRPERLLRVYRAGPPGKPGVAALVPVELLLPQVALDGTAFKGHAQLAFEDGTAIGSSGVEPTPEEKKDQIVSSQRSDRYVLAVTVALPRSSIAGQYVNLQRISMVVTGLIAVVILMVALILSRQQRDPVSEIEAAIEAGEFIPYYQPIVDIKSGGILGAEVLVRWRKPDGTIVMPGTFIPLVESSGLIVDMTRSLMWQVCHDVGKVLGRRPHMYLAFNVAPLHFEKAGILEDVHAIFDDGPITPSQLVLELTERYEIENLAETRNVIGALQEIGCRVAIDDVGTGHSGLSYILKLGVDIIKIDKLFVEAIRTERHSQAIVGTLVDLASNLRMSIVAEGVEHFEQVIYLREHGISAAQGYVFAPPLPVTAFLQLVEAIDPLKSDARAQDDSPQKVITELNRFAAA